MLPKEVFEEYAKARMKALIEKGEIPAVIVGGFIDFFGDAQIVNCSKCDTPLLLRPWLVKIVRQHNIRVECMCCADPQEVKGQVAMDFARIEGMAEEALATYIKQNWTAIDSFSGPFTQTPYSTWRSPDGKIEIGIHDQDNEIFCVHIVETGEWHIATRDIQRILAKLKEG